MFDHWYRSIRDMIRRNLLDVRMARAIVRKSGIRPGGSTLAGPSVLWSGGNLPIAPDGYRSEPANEHQQAAIYPPVRWPETPQLALVNLDGTALARVSGPIMQLWYDADVAILPIYSQTMNPMAGENDYDGLAEWTTPDARTMLDWYLDISGPQSFEWPPLGAAHLLGDVTEEFTSGYADGHWMAPPLSGDALLGVGVLTMAQGLQPVEYGHVQVQGVGEPTPDFLDYYDGRIDGF